MTGKHGSVEDRFWRHVIKGNDCWLWRSAGYPSGYGALKVAGSMKPAHRISWEIHRGSIPEGMLVCHTCDVRRCVRPDHLFLGTNLDNMADMRSKGRKIYHGGHPPRKLSADQISEIKELLSQGLLQREVAARFDVTQATISRNIKS